MRLRSKLLLVMLAAAFPEAYASESGQIDTGGRATALIHDAQGNPVYSSAGECWHSSLPAASAAMAAGCRASGSASVAAAAPPAPGAAETANQGQTAAAEPSALAAGASQTEAEASGTGRRGKSAAYVSDSRGIVVRGSGGECWRTSTWTPEQATVVGCDGVLAKALPVPAPAEAGKAAPPGTPSQVLPAGPSGQAQPVAPAQKGSSGDRVAPVVPVAPSAPPATLSPQGEAGALQPEPASEKVTFDTDTFFDFDKSVLKPEGQRKLDTLTSRLANTTVEVVVAVGHTDAIGTQTYNKGLSERRARAVANYLLEKGVPKEKIFTEGKGETLPLASNASKAGRAKNRRVEVEVVSIRSKK